MRCPKCGYISFDHVETCLKCKKDISGEVEVEGTTYNAAAPSFLKVPARILSDKNDAVTASGSEHEEEEHEFSDPTLDVLTEEDSDEATISFDDPDVGGDEDDFQLEADEEIEFDGNNFEFDQEDEEDESSADQSAAHELNIPDELIDISDLAPPKPVTEPDSDELSISFDDDLDLDEDSVGQILSRSSPCA